MRTSTEVGIYHPTLRPVCTCRCCRARRVRWQPRVVESTLITVGQQPRTAGKQRARQIGHLWAARMVRLSVRSRWGLASAGLLLVLLLLTGVGMLWDLGPLAPLLFRPTATVTIVPTRLDSQATLVITAVTGTPDTCPARGCGTLRVRDHTGARSVWTGIRRRACAGHGCLWNTDLLQCGHLPADHCSRHGAHGSRRRAGGHRCCGTYPGGKPAPVRRRHRECSYASSRLPWQHCSTRY